MKLWDGSEVQVYYQAPGQYVFNITVTEDEYPFSKPQNRRPLCTLLNGGWNPGNPCRELPDYPDIIYELNDNGRMTATIRESPTFIPCWTGRGIYGTIPEEAVDLFNTDYGKWYWNENIFK